MPLKERNGSLNLLRESWCFVVKAINNSNIYIYYDYKEKLKKEN